MSTQETLPDLEQAEQDQQLGWKYDDVAPKVRALFMDNSMAKSALGESDYNRIAVVTNDAIDKVGRWQRIANQQQLRLISGLSAEQVAAKYDDLKRNYGEQFFGTSGPIGDSEFFAKQAGLYVDSEKRTNALREYTGTIVEGLATGRPASSLNVEFSRKYSEDPAFADKYQDATSKAISATVAELKTRINRLEPAIQQAVSYANNGNSGSLTEFLSLPDDEQELAAASAAYRLKREKGQTEGSLLGDVAKSAYRGGREMYMQAAQAASTEARSVGITRDMADPAELKSRRIVEKAFNSITNPTAQSDWGESSFFSTKYWKGALDSAAGSVFQSSISMTPPGMAISYLANKQTAKDELAKSYGVEDRVATMASDVLAVPLTALNYVESAVIFGKFAKIDPIAFARKSFAAKAGELLKGFGTNVATEVATEKLQMELPKIGAEVLEAAGLANDVTWSVDDLTRGLKEITGPSLIFGLVGSGNAIFDSKKVKLDVLREQNNLLRAGYTAEDIAQLQEAGNLQEFNDKVVELHRNAADVISAKNAEAEANASMSQALSEIGTVEWQGGQMAMVSPKPETENAMSRNPDAAKVFAEERAEEGVFVELKDPAGNIVPGVVSGYWQSGKPNVGVWVPETRTFTDGPLQEGWEVITPVSGEADWLVTKVPTPETYSVTRTKNGMFEVRNEIGEVIVKAKSPDHAAELVKEHAAGRVPSEPVLEEIPNKAETLEQQFNAPTPGPVPEVKAHAESDSSGALPTDTISLNKKTIGPIRKQLELESLSQPLKRKWASLLSAVSSNQLQKNALTTSLQARAEERVLTDLEHAANVVRIAEIMAEVKDVKAEYSQALKDGDTERQNALLEREKGLRDEADVITEVDSYYGGTEVARALNARKLQINADTYALETLTNDLEMLARRKASESDIEKLTEYAKQIEELTQNIAKLEEELGALREAELEKKAEEFVSEGARVRKNKRERTEEEKAAARLRRNEALDKLKALGYRLGSTYKGFLVFEEASIIAEIADTYIEEGMAILGQVKAAIKKDLPDITDAQLNFAIGRGSASSRKILENEAASRKKLLHKQAKILLKIDKLIAGEKEVGKKVLLESPLVIKNLLEVLEGLRSVSAQAGYDSKALAKTMLLISEAQDMLETGYRLVPKAERKRSDELIAAKESLAEVRAMIGDQDKIFELEELLRTWVFQPKDQKKKAASREAYSVIIDALKKQVSTRKRAEAIIERFAKSQSDTLSFGKSEKDELTKAIQDQINKPSDDFVKTLTSIGVNQGLAESIASLVSREIEIRKEIASAKSTIASSEKFQRSVDSVIDRFAKSQSDTLSWNKQKKNAVSEAVNKQIKTQGSDFIETLQKLGVNTEDAALINDLVVKEIAIRNSIRDERARQRQDEMIEGLNEKLFALENRLENFVASDEELTKAKKQMTDTEKQIRDKIREVSRHLRVKESIADIEKQIVTGKFKIGKDVVDVNESKELQLDMIKLKAVKRDLEQFMQMSAKRDAIDWLFQVRNELTALKATADFSTTLNQGFVPIARLLLFSPFTEGKMVPKVLYDSIKAAFNQETFDRINGSIELHPDYVKWNRAGLFISSMDADPTKREETAMALFIKRIPGIGTVLNVSERHAVALANMLRVILFQSMMTANKDATAKQQKLFARIANEATGRGSMSSVDGKINAESLVRLSNLALFSTRFSVSRLQVLLGPAIYARLDKTAAKEATKNWISFVAANMAIMGVAKLFGADVGTDPDESNWAMWKIGKQNYDMMAGIRPPARLVARLLSSVNPAGVLEEDDELRVARSITDYWMFKASPLVTGLLAAGFGQDIFGRKVEGGLLGIAETIGLPITAETMLEAWRAEADASAVARAMIMSGLGASVRVEKD